MQKIPTIRAGYIGEISPQFLANKKSCCETMLIIVHDGVSYSSALNIQGPVSRLVSRFLLKILPVLPRRWLDS